MAIKPTYKVGKNHIDRHLKKKFTNWKDALNYFRTKYNSFKNKSFLYREPSALFFYGVGGVGKSRLLEEIMVSYLNTYPKCIYSWIDFADPSLRSTSKALINLKENISKRKIINFNHFDIAYAVYFKKKNPEISIKKKDIAFLNEAGIIGSILSTVDGFGIAGAATGIVNKIYEYYAKLNLNHDIKGDLSDLETLPVLEIEKRLISFFAYDFEKSCLKHNIETPVFLIDTYEDLWSESRHEGNIFIKDAWVRELVASLPFSLFIMAGREKLRWEEIDSEWRYVVDNHLLESFDENDSGKFLTLNGVSDSNIRNAIISSSEGHPYHLDLAVDTYYEIRKLDKKPSKNDFGKTKRLIFERFISKLERSEIETLKILSIPRFYNYDLFESLIQFFETGYPISAFSEFNRFSFLKKRKDIFYIHGLMRQSLNHFIDNKLKVRVNQFIADFYEKNLSNANDQDFIINSLSEAYYHRSNYLKNIDLQDWAKVKIIDTIRKLQFSGATNFLAEFLSNLKRQIAPINFDTDLFSILIDMVHLNGSYKDAADMISDYLKNIDLEDIVEFDYYLLLYIRRIHHQMFYLPVAPLIEKLLKLLSLLDKDRLKECYNELLFMIGGNLGTLSGDYDFSLKWLMKSKQFTSENRLNDYTCRTLRKISDIFRYKGEIEEALELCDKAINLAEENRYLRYKIYLLCSNAEIYREMKQFEKSKMQFLNAQKLAIEHGIQGWVSHTYLGLGELCIGEMNVTKAEFWFKKAISIYNAIGQKWGEIQSNIGLIKCYMLNEDLRWVELAKNTILEWKRIGYEKDQKLISEIINESKPLNNILMFL